MSIRSIALILVCLGLVTPVARAQGASAASPLILVLGDSISAAYGLDAGQGWVRLLEQKLKARGAPHRVVNASVTGETTAGGLARLPGLLERHKPSVVLVELGGNDGLRALPVKAMRANLERIIELTRNAGAQPAMFEMRIPDNYGPAYTEAFARVFTEISRDRNVPMVPIGRMHFVTDPKSFQEDGIHPGPVAQPQILDAAWPTLEPLLQR
ncbi:MAG: arylesterase [Panacagrimonas sp.]|jgi:acyl-CoA thioesterase-1|nr:arylesterase [Panacagrimonas sp.]MCC2656566.1 arylesterase [Panacagrimonas sp.]